MARSDLTEFEVEEEGFKLKIRRGANGQPVVATGRGSNTPFPVATDSTPAAAPTAPAPVLVAPVTGGNAPAEEAGVIYIKSPMVGTFYGSPSPESKAFVEKGAKIAENTVVCIIEAMKIMNEIQAEVKGTIIEALVENGQPVEYGETLFLVKPN